MWPPPPVPAPPPHRLTPTWPLPTPLHRCDPQLILFSGHSFAGSLAFELPNGRIELPPPNLFIEQLATATNLRCCFLNGCNTAELGGQIVAKLPHLKVICWASVAEDAAARFFALGFYDAVGAFLSSGEELQVEVAFWAGLERFAFNGFLLGDPAEYLHPPAHPHTFRPVFSPPCPGCTPPVHGIVQLLRNNGGRVERMALETQNDAFWCGPVGIQHPLSCAPARRTHTLSTDAHAHGRTQVGAHRCRSSTLLTQRREWLRGRLA